MSSNISFDSYKSKNCSQKKKSTNEWGKEELIKICKDLNLTFKSKMTKIELCKLINNHFNSQQASPSQMSSQQASSSQMRSQQASSSQTSPQQASSSQMSSQQASSQQASSQQASSQQDNFDFYKSKKCSEKKKYTTKWGKEE